MWTKFQNNKQSYSHPLESSTLQGSVLWALALSYLSRIENETDLHVKVVSFLKKRFPYSIFVAPLGENQDTSIKRIDSCNKGYIKGTPDLIINNLHRYYTGFAIEFKTPKCYGTLSNEQSNILFHYQLNGFKTLVSNDYDRIVEELLVYFRDVRVKCSFCPRGSLVLNH